MCVRLENTRACLVCFIKIILKFQNCRRRWPEILSAWQVKANHQGTCPYFTLACAGEIFYMQSLETNRNITMSEISNKNLPPFSIFRTHVCGVVWRKHAGILSSVKCKPAAALSRCRLVQASFRLAFYVVAYISSCCNTRYSSIRKSYVTAVVHAIKHRRGIKHRVSSIVERNFHRRRRINQLLSSKRMYRRSFVCRRPAASKNLPSSKQQSTVQFNVDRQPFETTAEAELSQETFRKHRYKGFHDVSLFRIEQGVSDY